LRPHGELRAAFGAVDLSKSIVTTCGSGISAAILMLALEEIGAGSVALYDGSWTEWGRATRSAGGARLMVII